ncbi:caffeoylshikimate esterase-like isoform X1 [Miscanthus floridulus]|uniref:caffeoylshikimate esterase-like isoform X1 n=2 Tax=Miscanthus floridulus TaxID=154761 RepID=UPI00345A075B
MDNGDIKYDEEYVLNARGINLFTCQWRPLNSEPKALIFLCHGYAMECSISMRGTGTRLAQAGFVVHGMDYEGHGKSSGLQGYISSFDDIVVDCSKYFASVCEKEEYKKQKRFLLGESMGGAIVLMLHRKEPTFWDGAILVAPMCKIVEDMKPHPIVISILSKLSNVIPTWRIIPNEDIIDRAIKSEEWREEVRNNHYCYKGKPRLKTGYEIFMASLDIESNLDKVTLPFIIVHGGDDAVTDTTVSEALYTLAESKDKTLKLYPGMCHALTSGEPKENIDIVFADIIKWLNERVPSVSQLGSNSGIQLQEQCC